MPCRIALASAALMVFTYAGYPFIAFVLAVIFRRAVARAEFTPKVTVILPVHNEGERLRGKVGNLLSQEYPQDRMEIVVVNDGSEDGSVEDLRRESPAAVKIVTLPERQGKASAINAGLAAATGEVIVFTDARQALAQGTLEALLSSFADARVAGVTGRLVAQGGGADGFFRRYEERLRSWEAAWGSCTGATGALYAVRRTAAVPLPRDTILDDLVMWLCAGRAGRLVYEKDAVAVEPSCGDGRTWHRRLRTLAGNWQILLHGVRFKRALSPRVTVQLACHKGLRLLFPFFACAFVAGAALAWPLGALAAVAAGAVSLALSFALRKFGWIVEIMMSLFVAPVEALVRYMSGRESVLWAK